MEEILDIKLACKLCFMPFNLGSKIPKDLQCQCVLCFECCNKYEFQEQLMCPFDYNMFKQQVKELRTNSKIFQLLQFRQQNNHLKQDFLKLKQVKRLTIYEAFQESKTQALRKIQENQNKTLQKLEEVKQQQMLKLKQILAENELRTSNERSNYKYCKQNITSSHQSESYIQKQQLLKQFKQAIQLLAKILNVQVPNIKIAVLESKIDKTKENIYSLFSIYYYMKNEKKQIKFKSSIEESKELEDASSSINQIKETKQKTIEEYIIENQYNDP